MHLDAMWNGSASDENRTEKEIGRSSACNLPSVYSYFRMPMLQLP
jgi:hypothetical protein